MHVESNLNDEIVFELSKTIYKQMKADFDQNFIGEKNLLKQFNINYLEPLYPTKRKLQNQQNQSESTRTQNLQEGMPSAEDLNTNLQQNQSAQESSSKNAEQVQYDTGIKKYSIKQLCLYLGLGNFLCWKSSPPDPVYEDLGLGICLYLKFMKHMVYTLVILSIFPIMQIVFFYSISQSNKFQPKQNYQKTLFSMSIGTLSLQGIKCAHKTLSNSTSYNFNLYCPIGQVKLLGPVYSKSKLSNLRACKQDINNLLDRNKQYIDTSLFSYVTKCQEARSNCTYTVTLAKQQSSYSDLSLTYQCWNGKSSLGSIQISRSTALICSIIFDLLFIFALIVFFWSEIHAEKKQKNWFKSKQLLLNQFSVQISHFSKHNFLSEFTQFLTALKKQMESQNALDENLFHNIVQIKLPENNKFEQLQQQRQISYQTFYKLMGQTFIDRKRDPFKYIDPQDFKTYAFRRPKDYQTYKTALVLCLNQYLKTLDKTIENQEELLKIFVVFSRPKYKRFLLQKTEMVGRSRFWRVDQNSEKSYRIQQPAAPALVLWKNMNKKNKVLRNVISWTITVIIIGITFLLIAFMLWARDQVLKNYNFNVQCRTLFPDYTFTTFNDQMNELNPQTYLHCFCMSKSVVLAFNNEPQCKQWSLNYTLYLFIPIIFSIVIVLINAIISAIYKALSRFEAHNYLTSELYSYIIKKTLLLVLNLALIIIVLSIDTQANNENQALSFLFQGIYNDITADWYLQVGFIITLSMIFNLFSPFAESIVFVVVSIITKILLIFFNKKPLHQKTKQAYINLYRDQTFPIEERYALVLAVLTITLCLNFVFPVMTLILLLTLFFLQINDKVLVIKAYQKPINFGTELHGKFMKSLLIILMIHLVITSILITEPFLLAAGDFTLEGSAQKVSRKRFDSLFETPYVIPYVILLVIILLTLFIDLFAKLYTKTKPNQRMYLGLDGIPFEQHKFHHLLNTYELNRTLALKKHELQKLKIIEQTYLKPQIVSPDELNKQNQPVIDSSANIIQNQLVQSDPKAFNSNQCGSILQSIAQHNINKLQFRKKQNIKDKERIVKLAGMTLYQSNYDWIFFDEYPNANFEVPSLLSLLQRTNILLNKNIKEQQNYNERHLYYGEQRMNSDV